MQKFTDMFETSNNIKSLCWLKYWKKKMFLIYNGKKEGKNFSILVCSIRPTIEVAKIVIFSSFSLIGNVSEKEQSDSR